MTCFAYALRQEEDISGTKTNINANTVSRNWNMLREVGTNKAFYSYG